MEQEELIELLRESLSLSVLTSSEYVGDMNGSALYKDSHTLQLTLYGEVISEVCL